MVFAASPGKGSDVQGKVQCKWQNIFNCGRCDPRSLLFPDLPFIRDKGRTHLGAFDEMNNELVFHDTPDEGGEDLLDNIVVKTLVNGGEVFLLEKDNVECVLRQRSYHHVFEINFAARIMPL